MQGTASRFLIGAVAAGAIACASTTRAEPIAPAPAASAPAPIPIAAEVAAAYGTFRIQPMWFHNGVPTPAVEKLITILKRAPFDGFPEGTQLAAEVEATVAQVAINPTLAARSEQMLSTAWVHYVQELRRPTPGMIYAYPVLKPRATRADELILTAAAAPSLADNLEATSELNPVYAKLRDAAWAEAQTNGNFTPDPRLLANLDRARSIPARGRFALVDSGDQRLTLFENGQSVDSMKVIVGTNQLPTPLIASIIYYVTFHPYWHAPDHLVRKTIAPTVLRQGMKYLKSHGYHVVSDWTGSGADLDPTTIDWKGAAAGSVHLLVQQDPGPLNSMGNLKFPFDNPEGIYLHDTPSKDLFAKETRFLSNGCVRLEDARRFGRWLLGTEPVAPGATPETPVQLPKGVPIILTYLTAQVVDGKIVYLPDIYGWDKAAPPEVASAN
ncbi:MAG TPA: L,D-transpeptidase family protein [Sphingomicrobium sp.]|nr:L,D-transpeptidase family protein [Sphingomicrobium sp.]